MMKNPALSGNSLPCFAKSLHKSRELPLEINKSDMFKRTAEGTIGTGQASIKMATDMGKIKLKWQPSFQDEVKL